MKNYEKYADEIREFNSTKFCKNFVQPHILKKISCTDIGCGRCQMLQMIWLLEDYEEPEEPETDWSQVKVDTPILVRQGKTGNWLERHFAKYENGEVYAWVDGQTSWTGADEIKWKYAKLAEDEKECEEPKVDWSKVKVDTPILVRTVEGADWVKRNFAKYEGGMVYVWNNGKTSWTTPDMISSMTSWNYAKLAESEEE